MAHYQQNKFIDIVRDYFPKYFQNKRVLEVGSWDVNGNVRNKFISCEYIGVDITKGQGVDIVCEGQNLDFPANHFDVVISCESFEHNRYWLETFMNMVRMLKPSGLCVFTCATIGRGEHGTRRRGAGASLSVGFYSEDYYVNLNKNDFLKRINLSNHFMVYKFFTNIYMRDLYFVGIKKSSSESSDLKKLFSDISRNVQGITFENGSSLRKMILKRIKFNLIYVWAKLLGEKKYHNLRHVMENFSHKVRG
ncbi:MAG: methyltransferase domain-containing protein [Nitrospiria bacterium]